MNMKNPGKRTGIMDRTQEINFGMKVKLGLITATLLALIAAAGLACDGKEESSPSEAIREMLADGGIEQPEVAVYEARAIVRHNIDDLVLLPTGTELLNEWAYIMGKAVKEAPWIDEVVIRCVMEGEEIMEVTGKTDDIIAFLCGETTSEEFLPKLVLRPIGKGPLLKPPGE
jgi:hypothetical protein